MLAIWPKLIPNYIAYNTTFKVRNKFSLDEDGLIDYFCRTFFSCNIQRCKWDLENIYRKKLRKHFASVISNLNLYSQDLIPIITSKSGKSSNEYIQFALFLTEMGSGTLSNQSCPPDPFISPGK